VSGQSYHSTRTDLILVPATTRPPHDALDFPVSDWQGAGLLRPSTVCAKPVTFYQTRVLHRAGRLCAEDLARLDSMLVQALELDTVT